MEYKGALYGKVGGMIFKTGKTSEDWDKLEAKVIELQELVNKNNLLSDVRLSLPTILQLFRNAKTMNYKEYSDWVKRRLGYEA